MKKKIVIQFSLDTDDENQSALIRMLQNLGSKKGQLTRECLLDVMDRFGSNLTKDDIPFLLGAIKRKYNLGTSIINQSGQVPVTHIERVKPKRKVSGSNKRNIAEKIQGPVETQLSSPEEIEYSKFIEEAKNRGEDVSRYSFEDFKKAKQEISHPEPLREKSFEETSDIADKISDDDMNAILSGLANFSN